MAQWASDPFGEGWNAFKGWIGPKAEVAAAYYWRKVNDPNADLRKYLWAVPGALSELATCENIDYTAIVLSLATAAGGARPGGPRAPKPVAATGKLPIPRIPEGVTQASFGRDVMKWGTGNAAARGRIASLTREELTRAGVSRDMALAWRDFYRNEAVRNPRNPSAAGRADLMNAAAKLLK
jgi:hypothetical protein